VLAVDTGTLVTVKDVEVHGDRRVRASFIRSRVELEPGDRYDGRKVRDSFRNLYRTGLFESVSIELGPGEEERPLVVTVVEAPTLEFFVEPGYGSYEGLRLRLGVEKRSIFGTDRSVRFESTASWKAQEASVQLVDPWMFDVDLTGTASFFGGRRIEPSFTEQDYGAGLGFRRRWSSRWSTNVAYNFTRTILEDVDIDDPPDPAFVDDVDIGSITLGVTRDDRNNIFYPSGGSRESLTFEWGDAWLGGELEFLSGRFEGALFQRLFSPKTVLGLSARTGVIVPVGSTAEIPLQRRYFNGGENTVRSFGESELGPKDSSGDPVGGEAFSVFSVEVRQILNDPLSVALFYDLGNVVVNHEDYFDFANLAAGVGAGVRYLLPIGVVRLDAAWNPDPESGEDDYIHNIQRQ
jgi:outer membrane protein assembly factor BamA